MTTRILIVALVATLSGCASQPISNAESRHIPAEQRLNASLFLLAPGSAEVTIKRDDSFSIPCSTKIFIDGGPVANVYKTEKAVVFLSPGDHIISARTNGICGTGTAEIRASFKSGEKSNFRITYSMNGEVGIAPTAF